MSSEVSFTGACKSPVPSSEGYVCPYCPYVRESAAMVRGHINCNHELVNFYECPNCPFTTMKQKSMKDHLVENHSGNYRDEPTFADIIKLKVNDPAKVKALQIREKGVSGPQHQQQEANTTGGGSQKGKVVSKYEQCFYTVVK